MAMRALVAVVDDDPTLADLITEVLELGGFETHVISDPDAAFDRVALLRPAVVLLDLRIERRQAGWELLERLHHDPGTAAIPVIVCTADDGFLREHADDLAARGVPCLPKPFEIDDLIAAVSHAARHVTDGPEESCPGAAAP